MADKPLSAYAGDESYIFVTYSHEDSDLVYPQIRWLQDQGFNVAWDEGISPGAVWRSELAQAIRECSLLLYFTTPNSVASEHCAREVNFALDEHHRPVLAVHLVETVLPDALALSLSDRQAILQHALESEDYERKLVSAIATYLDQPVPPIESSLPAPSRKSSQQVLLFVTGLLVGSVAVLITWVSIEPETPQPRPLSRFIIELPEGVTLPFGLDNHLSIDAHGERIFFVGEKPDGRRQVYIRPLDQLESYPISGTEDTAEERLLSAYPSPDGNSIAMSYDNGMVKRVSTSGGLPTLVAESRTNRLARLHWGPQDRIALRYDNGASLAQAMPSGGELETLITSDAPSEVTLPHYAPDKQSLFFASGVFGEYSVMVMALDDREPKRLLAQASDPRVTSSGHLLFFRNDAVWAVALDKSGRDVAGTPVVVLQDAAPAITNARYAVSTNGTLVYQPSTQRHGFKLIWVDRQGRQDIVDTFTKVIRHPEISPDQRHIAFTTPEQGELWTYSFESRLQTRRWQSPVQRSSGEVNWPGVWAPSWSPDGTRIAFSDWQSDTPNIYIADLTSEAPARRVTKTDLFQWAYGWTNDGEFLLFEECTNLYSSCDIGLLPIDPPGEAKMIMSGVANEGRPALSPDNEHLAYISDASGFERIVIQPFPINGRDRAEVPIDGCDSVKWSPNGTELFGFCNGRLMAIPFHRDPVLSVGLPVILFSVDSSVVRSSRKARFFDVSADGERFLMVEGEREPGTNLVVVLNWLNEVERLVPTE